MGVSIHQIKHVIQKTTWATVFVVALLLFSPPNTVEAQCGGYATGYCTWSLSCPTGETHLGGCNVRRCCVSNTTITNKVQCEIDGNNCTVWNSATDICDITTGCAGQPTPTPNSLSPAPTLQPFQPVTSETLDSLNPLLLGGGNNIDETIASPYAGELSNPGGVVSRALEFAIPIAGLILFVMLVWGGFEMLVGAPSGKSIDAGKQRVTAAIIGFILLFSSYWLMQIVEVVFGVVIL